jgi:hypothetical protein
LALTKTAVSLSDSGTYCLVSVREAPSRAAPRPRKRRIRPKGSAV